MKKTHGKQSLGRAVALGLALSAAAPGAGFADGGPRYKPLSLELPSKRAGFLWGRFNNDARLDAAVVEALSITILRQNGSGGFESPGERITLERGGLFDLADLNKDGLNELVILQQDAVQIYEPLGEGGRMVRRETPLVSGLRGVAFQHLVSADFMFDLDNDGDEDLVYPVDGRSYLYFNSGGTFTKENQLTTRPISVDLDMGEDLLRDKIESRVRVPRLQFLDVNGDGRLDLHASDKDIESFYVQSADGRIAQTPTYTIDLKRFKEQVPDQNDWTDLDQFQFIPIDVDADKDQDYVIVAGPKVWVFKSGPNGPDLNKPDQLLKVSTNYMNVAVMPIDDDEKPELVIFKYDLPSLGRIVAGLAIGLRLEMEILGYANTGNPVFERSPNQRSTYAFKAPPIFRLLGDLDKLVNDFNALRREAHSTTGGDFNGDKSRDLARIEGSKLEFFISEPGSRLSRTDFYEEFGDPKLFRETLFAEKRREVTLDTIFSFISDTIEQFQQAAISGRKPDFAVDAPPDYAARVLSLSGRDLNGDGRDDVAMFLGPKDGKEYKIDETQTLAMWVSE